MLSTVPENGFNLKMLAAILDQAGEGTPVSQPPVEIDGRGNRFRMPRQRQVGLHYDKSM